jgi:hypothetical protein
MEFKQPGSEMRVYLDGKVKHAKDSSKSIIPKKKESAPDERVSDEMLCLIRKNSYV